MALGRHANADHVKNIDAITIGELLPARVPLCISQDARPLTAFKMMADNGVCGLAVVDAAGTLVDEISVRDLRGMSWDGMSSWPPG